MQELVPLLEAVAMAAMYSLVIYQQRHPNMNLENFDWVDFGTTVGVGIFVGASMVLAGDPLSAASLEAKLATYAGLIVFIERGLKMVKSNYQHHTGGN